MQHREKQEWLVRLWERGDVDVVTILIVVVQFCLCLGGADMVHASNKQ